jgi:hypothetical protein
MFSRSAVALAWAVAACGAHAAEGGVYRCGPAYQQTPCEGGQAVDAADARGADQRRDARQAAAADQRQANALVAERKAREKQPPAQQQPIGLGAKPAAAPASAPAAGGIQHPKKNHRKSKPDESPRYLGPPASKS